MVNIFAFILHIWFYGPVGLASIVTGPTDQTTCYGGSSSFDCVISDFATISWLINGQELEGQGGLTNPGTTPLSPGAKSTLILPGSSSFSGASVVCSYMFGQIPTYSVPAFLTIRGMSEP